MGNLKSPLNLLILIGLICQGKSSEDDMLLFIYCACWFIILILKVNKRFLSESLEFIVLFTLLILCYKYVGSNIFEKCIALGNALAALQILRLTYELDYRKKILALAIALTQIAIGTQVFLDYSFILVLIFTLILVPKSLFCICISREEQYSTEKISFRMINQKTIFFMILFFAVLFFLFFPRINFEAKSRFYANVKTRRGSVYLTKPNLKTSLASLSKNDLSANEILFQVFAENIRYFKVLSLDEFDGDLWSISPFGYMRKKDFKNIVNHAGTEYRKVDIKYIDFKSRFLPVDGDVTYIEGNFFEDPVLTRIGNIVIPENINRKNKTYEYWVEDENENRNLSEKEFKRFTKITAPSLKLKSFIQNIIADKNTEYEKAQALCSFLKNNYKYELGGPSLDTKYPVEDFIFSHKSGQCERFASALAVLLRMISIPSMVAVGYLPREKNEMGGYYNVKSLDSHAWTEAYFKDKGWIILDSTPAADFAVEIQKTEQSGVTVYLDYIEYIWYSKIVNLSHGDQLFIFSYLTDFVKYIGYFFSKSFIYIIFSFFVLFIISILLVGIKKTDFKIVFFKIKNRKKIIRLEHFYDKMLKSLEKRDIKKPETFTPYEFLNTLKEINIEGFNDFKYITDIFCKMKYGLKAVSHKELNEIELLIEKIGRSELKNIINQ